MAKARKLTALQKRFCDEYLVDLCGTKAARRAGYKGKRPEVYASKQLATAHVQAYLGVAMGKRERRTEITQDRVLTELARIGFADMRGLLTWGTAGVELVESSKLTADQVACISEVSESDEGAIKLKLHDKVKSLELLGSHLGIWRQKVEHTGKNGTPLAPPVINIGFANGGPGGPSTSAKGS